MARKNNSNLLHDVLHANATALVDRLGQSKGLFHGRAVRLETLLLVLVGQFGVVRMQSRHLTHVAHQAVHECAFLSS